MQPSDTGKAYDQITHLWNSQNFNRNNGIDQHKRAISFTHNRGKALDMGCGCTGRFIDLLLDAGFTPEGVDISQEMIRFAQLKHPAVKFYQQDICEWSITERYDFVTAWDSLWHLPLNRQEPVLTKLVECLNPDGVLIFSFGGTDQASDHTNHDMGPKIYYSSLGVNGFLELLIRLGCLCRHLEYDQRPELHAYLIVQKA